MRERERERERHTLHCPTSSFLVWTVVLREGIASIYSVQHLPLLFYFIYSLLPMGGVIEGQRYIPSLE